MTLVEPFVVCRTKGPIQTNTLNKVDIFNNQKWFSSEAGQKLQQASIWSSKPWSNFSYNMSDWVTRQGKIIGPGFDKIQFKSSNLCFSILLIFVSQLHWRCQHSQSDWKVWPNCLHLDFDCCSWQHCLDDPCVQRRQAGPAGDPLRACSGRHILHKNRPFPFLTRSARHLLSTLLAHLVVDKTRFHNSSPAALNPDHCHSHKELLNVKPTKKTTRKAGGLSSVVSNSHVWLGARRRLD